MINEQKMAITFINSFVKKIRDDNRDVQEELKKIQIFTDPIMHRQRRFGLYAWIDYEDEDNTQIGASIDWLIENNTLCDSDVMGYAMVYAKSVWEDLSNYIEVQDD